MGAHIVLFKAATLLVLRAHYAADVFAGIITALWTVGAADVPGPAGDRALAALLYRVTAP